MIGLFPTTTFPAGTAMLADVAEMKVNGTAAPPNVAVQFDAKLVPENAIVAAAPTKPEPGVRVPIVGAAGGTMPWKLTVFEDCDCAKAPEASSSKSANIAKFFFILSPSGL
jgi:hypothetical protein